MKNILFLITVSVLFAACGKDAGPARFEMTYPNNEIDIQAGLNVFESHYYTIYRIPTNAHDYLASNGLEAEDIVSILPKTFRLTNLSSNAKYDFIQEISVRIFSVDDPGKKFEIFYDDNVPFRTGTRLDLIPNGNDMKDFLLDSHFSVEIVLRRLRDSPREFIRSRVQMVFEVR